MAVRRTEKRIPAMAAAHGVFGEAGQRPGLRHACFHKTHLQAPIGLVNRGYTVPLGALEIYFYVILRCSPAQIDTLAVCSFIFV